MIVRHMKEAQYMEKKIKLLENQIQEPKVIKQIVEVKQFI